MEKLSKKSIERWSIPEYKQDLINKHKKRFIDNPNLASETAKKTILNQKELGTYNQVKLARELGRQNFIKSLTQEEYYDKYAWSRNLKSEDHKKNISKALSDKPKSDIHRKNLALNRQKNKNILKDHVGCLYEVHKDFATKYGVAPQFYLDLDTKIRNKKVFEKLGIDYQNNKDKTKFFFGFIFIEPINPVVLTNNDY